MAELPKPIKRSPQLAPLSREHHEGLLAAWKLRQGLAKNIEAGRMAAFIHWFWQQHLAPHFQKEEQAFSTILPATNPLLQRMIREHAEIKKLVHQAQEHEDLKNFETLAQLLNDHIRFEERELFGEIEKAASPEQLEQLSGLLTDEDHNLVWEDEFWLRSA